MVKYIIPLLLVATTANANDSIDAQKDFTLGMYSATQNIAKQIWPEDSVLGQYHQNNQQTTEEAASNITGLPYQAGITTAIAMDVELAATKGKNVQSLMTDVMTGGL